MINKLLFTGFLSAVLIAGILSTYVPYSAYATPIEDPFDDCITSGNSALGQIGNHNEGEQGTGQAQSNDDSGSTQSVSPEFNGLTGNNLNLNDQQNGGCDFPFDGEDGGGDPGGPV
ncbi:MAG: hypothetical protein AB7V56_06885 [Candidatus Nitrosocosmicus sp.]